MIELQVSLKEVVISKLLDGVFHADMVCERSDGELMEIDARTSDAIALAVRFECPIYTYDNIMDAAGVIPDDNDLEEGESPAPTKKKKRKKKSKMSDYTVTELENWLEDVLEKEDYEQAAKIRDEIERRKS